MKLRSALLLVAAATVCALSSLISPQEAAASVDIVNQWPAKPTIASNNSTAGTLSKVYSPGDGQNRLMLVAIAGEYASGTPSYTVTYGGQALTGTIVSNTAQANKIWLGYFNETAIAAGISGGKSLQIVDSAAATRTALYATVAVYAGVNQTTPTTGSNSQATASAATLTLSIPLTGNAGLAGNTGMSVYVVNWNGQTSTPASGYTEAADYAGASFNLAACYKVTTGVTTESPVTTAAAATIGAAVGVSLNPILKPTTIATCGDCHGNPPQDGTARNVPVGQFVGAHNKHAGTNEGQYGILCTQCHRNNGTNLKHANGWKNISGSSVPRLTYGNITSIRMTSAPAFTQTCSKNNCHSTGRTNRQFATSPTWNSTTTCLSCHGGRSSSTNLYSRSANNFTLSTTHQQHLGKYTYLEINCNTCHGKTASSNSTTSGHTALKDYSGAIYHGNGSKTVLFTNIAYGSYTSYKTGAGADQYKCTNTACHGGKSRSAWSNSGAVNTDNTCVHCHGAAGTSAALANTAANRKFFAPGYKVGGVAGTSTDQVNKSNDYRVGSHFKHISSAYMKNIRCNECHRVPEKVFDGTHTAGGRFNSQTLTFAQSSSAIIAIGVAQGSTPSRLAAFAGYTNGNGTKAATCSSVYCHGNRMKNGEVGGTYRKPYWNYSAMINYTDPATACSRCHASPPTSNGHTQTTTLNATNPCSGCHANVVNSAGKIINKDLHINGIVEASAGHEYGFGGWKHKPGGSSLTIKAEAAPPFSSCGCHDTTTAGGGYPVTRYVAGNILCSSCHKNTANFTSTPGCGDCHGTNANGGQPNGGATAFPNYSGSHSAHIAMTYACDDCHNNAGTGHIRHGNYSGVNKTSYKNVSVSFNTAKSGTAAKWNKGTTLADSSCTASVCHGQKSPSWGAAVPNQQCRRCHGSQSVAYTGYTQATIAPGSGNNDTNQTAGITNRGGLHQEHLKGNLGIAVKVRCNACYTSPEANAVNHAQLDNRTTASVAIATMLSRTPTFSRSAGVITCTNTGCHAGKTGTGGAAPTWKDTAYLTGVNNTDVITLSDCQKCHALPPTPGAGKHASVAAVTGFPLNTQCASNCHKNLDTTANTYGTIFKVVGQHMNGSVEGGDCLGCHKDANGARAGVVGQMASQSHHVQGAELPLTNAHCYKCHWEANSDGTENTTYHSQTSNKGVSLVVWNGTTRPTTADSTTLVSYTANGSRTQIAKLNAVCLGCHNSAGIPAANMFGTYASDFYSPEPKMSPALGKTSILSRYSSTRTVAWSNYAFTNSSGQQYQYGTNMKSTITKALSAHGNAVKNQFPNWVATQNGTGEDETMGDIASSTLGKNRNVMCYDCHNSHGSAAAGITSSYSSATGRYKGGLLKTTVSGEAGYTVTYTPTARTIKYKSYSTTSTHDATFNAGASICNDCHNNDTRKVNISKPWSITGTYSSTKAIVGYWSTPYFDNYTFASAKRTTYKMGGAPGTIKDLRKPMGGHYGSSANLNNYSGVSHSQNINGLCTPCHDPHGVSSAMTAVNRGKSVPLLKGTWVTSPYREDKATPVVKRGGGSNFTGVAAMGATPGYNIDQNTLINLPAPLNRGAWTAGIKGNKRAQAFTAFPGAAGNALALHTEKTPADFAGLCIGCHQQATLTNTTVAPAASNWMSKQRVHQSVAGWAATSGTNANGTVHAYTCSKCHTPHVSRLPRLMVTNCLDVRHVKQSVAAPSGTIVATPPGTPGFGFGNVLQSYASSAYGAGRFPAGGSRYSGTPGSAQNNGPWYFQTVQPAAATYGSNCHNATNAGGATWAPDTQIWNRKTRW